MMIIIIILARIRKKTLESGLFHSSWISSWIHSNLFTVVESVVILIPYNIEYSSTNNIIKSHDLEYYLELEHHRWKAKVSLLYHSYHW